MTRRYSLNEITGVLDSYKGAPQTDAGVGQVVFALNTSTATTCIGQCVTGNQLIPWGLCCRTVQGVNTSGCTCLTSTTCGFCLCGGGTFVALGSINGCGATLFRRIS